MEYYYNMRLKKENQMFKHYHFIVIFSICLFIAGCQIRTKETKDDQFTTIIRNQEKRSKILEHLLKIFSSNENGIPQEVPIWEHWLRRTKELPPDFDELEANAFPPDLLRFRNGEQVVNLRQWATRRKEINDILKQYMFGDWPPPPPKMAIKYQNSVSEENDMYTIKNVQLFFSPSVLATEYAEHAYSYDHFDECYYFTATINVELFIPKVKGTVPAIIEIGTPRGDLRGLNLEVLKRGYLICRFYSKDANTFQSVYVNYECNQLEWWAYAADRCVDLLYTLDNVDKSKIAIYGHSRTGKTALLAAAMDDRINAIIDSHPGTGAGSYNLWRYAGDKYGGETLENSTRRYPYWNNPRMRFFIGRENKMPFDDNYLLALVAPRPCLLGTGLHDAVGEPWGDQQCYLAVKKVYQLLGGEQKLGFYGSPGAHEVTQEMVKKYLDWLDMQFGRKTFDFKEKLLYDYTFEKWKEITGENINVDQLPEREINDILLTEDKAKIKTKDEWEVKSVNVKNQIKWIMGDLPVYDSIKKIELINERSSGSNLKKAEILINEKLIAHLTWPVEKTNKLGVVIYLHAYLDANGYNWSRIYGYSTSVGERLAQKGFLAVEFDQFGYGLRNEDCDMAFFKENPKESGLGVMIQDVRKIIDAISLLEWVDKDKIMVAGYSLGGMVGLYSAVFDPRIKAVASTCGFGSMRLDVHGAQTEGIKRYSYLRSTIPRLGFFLKNEKRIPYDFHEILALIAPRPVYILAPKLDQDWFYEDVEICYREAVKIYDLYGKHENIVLQSPNDFNRYPPKYQDLVNNWLKLIAE